MEGLNEKWRNQILHQVHNTWHTKKIILIKNCCGRNVKLLENGLLWSYSKPLTQQIFTGPLKIFSLSILYRREKFAGVTLSKFIEKSQFSYFFQDEKSIPPENSIHFVIFPQFFYLEGCFEPLLAIDGSKHISFRQTVLLSKAIHVLQTLRKNDSIDH